MTQGRLLACAPVLSFAALAAALAGVGAVPAAPALLAALSVAMATWPVVVAAMVPASPSGLGVPTCAQRAPSSRLT